MVKLEESKVKDTNIYIYVFSQDLFFTGRISPSPKEFSAKGPGSHPVCASSMEQLKT